MPPFRSLIPGGFERSAWRPGRGGAGLAGHSGEANRPPLAAGRGPRSGRGAGPVTDAGERDDAGRPTGPLGVRSLAVPEPTDAASRPDPATGTPGEPQRQDRAWLAGLALNGVLRLSIAYFLVEVLLHPDDPRFAGKALPVRNLLIVGGGSLLFPVYHFWRRRWPRYPAWQDNLYLSLYWLDMAGNSFDLYDRYYYFDLIPHFHGTGAVAAVLVGAFDQPVLSAVGAANIVHLLLEAQEYYTDVFLGTRNVRGVADTVNDLVVGLLGTALYAWAAAAWQARRRSRAHAPR